MSAEPERSSSSEPGLAPLAGYWAAAVISARNYVSLYPPRIIALTILPRVLLQVAFLSYLGYYAAGPEGRIFAFIGAATHIMTMATVAKGPDAILDERVLGTLYRVRLGVLKLPGVVAARWLVFALEGFGASMVAILVLAVPFGGVDLLLQLLVVAPLIALLALTTSAFGLAIGSFALSYRADVLIVNFATYALLFACGVVAPLTAFGPIGGAVAQALPLTNGLLAIRNAVDGTPWLGYALLEVVVGVAWAIVAVTLLQRQDHRARRLGTDELL